ncbi:MAG: hypothetical protein IMZ61_13890 [Planctomycetes bacterium]|nr:hypothetical protein [Chloroflexota bacterium]MBE3144989.1 hypothetical protein [Planctomycetota bacterium]
MSERNNALFGNQMTEYKKSVWFSASTALKKGQGVCYDLDVVTTATGQTATDLWGRRGRVVAVPSTSNNMAFAGVTSQAYKACTGGQTITIYEPGSICEVLVGIASTIFSQAAGTRHTCSVNTADAGLFTFGALTGRGSAIALQTRAAATGGDITFSSFDGTALTSSAGTTITKTGIGTACGYGDSDIDATEFRVVVLGGASSDGTTALATAGEYAVATAPSADTITIATNIGASCYVALYVIKNTYATILCKLEDGNESGLLQVLTPKTATAIQSMVGGTTYLCGGYTMATASTATLADGMLNGMLKAYVGLGTLTTAGYVVTISGGLDTDGGACGTLTLDAAEEFIVFEFNGLFAPSATGGVWVATGAAGATRA